MAYITRAAEGAARRIADTFPVLVVTGSRQVGKSTMLAHLADETRQVVSLDEPAARQLAKSDPALFLQRFKPPLLIDEIQYAPELLPLIKLTVDKSGVPGQFWLTGSQSFHMMRHVSESLAGRAGVLTLCGLSSAEIAGVPSVPFDTDLDRLIARRQVAVPLSLEGVFQQIFTGAMPRLWTAHPPDWHTFWQSYLATYLQRDIRELTQVADEMAFLSFLTAVTARTARPVVMSEISKEVGISEPTVKRWLSVLVSSGLVVLVPPYANNRLTRMTKMPLLHVMDTGLAAHLLNWTDPQVLERGALAGQFFESWVFAQVYKSYANAGLEPPLFYYRDKDQREIDLLIERNGCVCPVEIKKASNPGKSALRGFRVLDGMGDELKTAVGPGAVVCLADDVLPLDERNAQVPAWLV